jgi:hypothetical protein
MCDADACDSADIFADAVELDLGAIYAPAT